MSERKSEWIKEYIDFMLVGDFENGIKLRDIYFPNSHFKYRPLDEYTLESIEYNTLWLAAIDSLNDPFECLLLLDNDECLRLHFSDKRFAKGFYDKFGVEITEKDLDKITKSNKPYEAYTKFCNDNGITLYITVEQQIELVQKRWREIVESEKQKLRICSFSERNDSLLMWSHYAEQHKGVCVEYDFSDDENRTFLSPVHYDDKLFKVQTMDDLTTLSHIRASLTKSKDWAYENEWRLTAIQNQKELKNKTNTPNPKAIYLGPRYKLNNEYKKKQLLRICTQKNIPVYQMKIHPTEYKVVVDYKLD